jgi:TonB family protein
VLLSLLSAPAAASAQTNANTQGSEAAGTQSDVAGIVAPRLQHFVEAPYPEEELDSGKTAEVLLHLDIDETGRVTRVVVHESAGESFDRAAVWAAKQFVFLPAIKDGEPVAVRIPFRYEFAFEERTLPSRYAGQVLDASTGQPLSGVRLQLTQSETTRELVTDGAGRFDASPLDAGSIVLRLTEAGYEPHESSDTLQAGESREVQLSLVPIQADTSDEEIEVVVVGKRPTKPTVVRSMQSEEMERVPGTFGDALRAIKALPGVAQTPSLSGLLVVRGTSPESTQVFFDGVYTPMVYHFGGLSSVVPTEMLESIDFQPGNFDVRYGRGIGGIVDAKIRSPRNDGKLHGLAQVDLVDARAMVEGPLPGDDGWRVMAGARRSHLDTWLGPLLEGSNTSFSSLPVYYDYQLFVQRDAADGSMVRIGFHGSDDKVSLLNDTDVFFNAFSQKNAFWNFLSEYRVPLGDGTSWQHVASIGRLIERVEVGPIHSTTHAVPMVFRGELTHEINDWMTLRAGPDILAAPFRVNFVVTEEAITGDPLAPSPVLRPPRMANSQSAFFQPGVFSSLELAVTDRLSLTPALRLDYTRGTDRWDLSPRLNAAYALAPDFPRTTLRAGAGVFREPPEVRFTLPEYGNADLGSLRALQFSLGVDQDLSQQVETSVEGFFSGLDEQLSQTPDDSGVTQLDNGGTGRVYGAELMLRYKNDGRFFGWLSYTLSRSERRYLPGAPMEIYSFDQTHIGSLLGSLQLGRGWEVGGRFRLVSGVPTIPCGQEILNSSEGDFRCLASGEAQGREPWFHQLDARVEKRWQLSTDFRLSAYLDVINVYNRQTADLPLTPSLGLRGEL